MLFFDIKCFSAKKIYTVDGREKTLPQVNTTSIEIPKTPVFKESPGRPRTNNGSETEARYKHLNNCALRNELNQIKTATLIVTLFRWSSC